MDIHETWEKALHQTDIVRSRVQALMTFAETKVPYIFLSKTEALNNTLIRQGEVVVDKPSLVLPPNIPQFFGFEFEKEEQFNREAIINFLLVRGVTLPSLKYNHKTSALHQFEGHLDEAVKHFLDNLQRKEDVHTGLIVGPEDCWQFSILIFVASQIMRSADGDIRRLLDDHWKNQSFN